MTVFLTFRYRPHRRVLNAAATSWCEVGRIKFLCSRKRFSRCRCVCEAQAEQFSGLLGRRRSRTQRSADYVRHPYIVREGWCYICRGTVCCFPSAQQSAQIPLIVSETRLDVVLVHGRLSLINVPQQPPLPHIITLKLLLGRNTSRPLGQH
jgi:hypothetical protein